VRLGVFAASAEFIVIVNIADVVAFIIIVFMEGGCGSSPGCFLNRRRGKKVPFRELSHECGRYTHGTE
jgi:hypothetical protein